MNPQQMAQPPIREFLFVDPLVPDRDTLLSNLRPGVAAVLLDGSRPAARQIADALAGHPDLDAVHIVAHGSPGRVSFAAGPWSAATLADPAADLSAIGRALAAGGELRVWACRAGAEDAGADFADRLALATGATAALAGGPVGAAALGGRWELSNPSSLPTARAPLTEAGVCAYAGLLTDFDLTVSAASGAVPGATYYIY